MRKFFIGLLLIFTGIAALMLIPSPQAPAPMPWDIKLFQDGSSEVFDIRFNHSTLADAQRIFKESGEIAIFHDDKAAPVLEVFFTSVHLGGLSAKIVLTLATPENKLIQMLGRASSSELQPSRARRYQLATDDQQKAMTETVFSLTYIPSIRLNEEAIRYRFGDPVRIEPLELSGENGVSQAGSIWHYPSIGLNIRLVPKEKTVLQYQAPATYGQY